MAALAYIDGVTTIELDETRCNGCKVCLKVCPRPVFRARDRVVELAEPDLCIECGACVLNCSEEALRVSPGVGCAAAILHGWIRRSKPSCGCG